MNAWQIEHQCPQCGGPVLLDETDRLLDCRFCRTRLFMTAGAGFRYVLPPAADPAARELFFLPYWRLKGTAYACRTSGIAHRVFDATAPALDVSGLPRTLGVRPQAMKLKFWTPRQAGRVLEPGVTREAVIRTVAPQTAAEKDGFLEFIGETASLIFAPVYFEKQRLFDGLLKRPLPVSAEQIDALTALLGTPQQPVAAVRFLPAQCPGCGWDMEGERDGLVMICRNCQAAWDGREGGWETVDFRVLPASAEDVFYLPFWRMQARLDGLQMDTFSDLIRFANLPKVVTPALSAAPLHFWAPAFKILPAQFLRWSRQLTACQPAEEGSATFPGTACHPVTLPLSEALESIRITLAELASNKREALARLSGLRAEAGACRIVYHPFRIGRSELLHETLGLTLDRAALSYGSQL